MGDIFVFTAINRAAKFHLEDSIRNPVPINNIRSFSSLDEQKRLEDIAQKNGGLFAWGAKRGKANAKTGRYRNIDTWSQMHPGDYVLGVYDNNYRVFAWVQYKFHNPEVAKAIWGVDGEDEETWEYIYIISEPQLIKLPVSNMSDYLPGGYVGFTRVSQERIEKVSDHYDSLERFFNIEFGVTPPSGYGGDQSMVDAQQSVESKGAFTPIDMGEARQRTYEVIAQRKGPSHLLHELTSAYDGCCTITGECCPEVLEAAYLLPFKAEHTHHVSNALLMRSDIHTLFDRGLIAIDSADMSIIVSDRLMESGYATLQGTTLRPPLSSDANPNKESLDIHRRWCGL